MEHRLPSCRIVLLLVILAVAPVFNGRGSFAAAQDLPPAFADVTLWSPSQISASEQPTGQTDQPPNAAVDLATSSLDGQGQQADPQTEQASTAPAPNKERPDRFVRNFVGDFFHDQYRMWTGPFHAHNYDSHTMKKYGIPFILITAALIATDRDTAKWLPNTSAQVLWSERVSDVGAPYSLAGFSMGMYLIGRAVKNDHTRESGFLALEAVADSQFIDLILKEAFSRQRPLEGSQRGGFWEGGGSFPSGHAAGAFAFAAVMGYEYRDHIAIPITAYAFATIIDASRLGARQHWLSDIFVGSAVGFLAGRYVYKRHHDPNLPGSWTSRLRPQLESRPQGTGLYWDF